MNPSFRHHHIGMGHNIQSIALQEHNKWQWWKWVYYPACRNVQHLILKDIPPPALWRIYDHLLFSQVLVFLLPDSPTMFSTIPTLLPDSPTMFSHNSYLIPWVQPSHYLLLRRYRIHRWFIWKTTHQIKSPGQPWGQPWWQFWYGFCISKLDYNPEE